MPQLAELGLWEGGGGVIAESRIARLLRWRQQNPDIYAKKRNEAVAKSEKVKRAARATSFLYRDMVNQKKRLNPKFQKGEQHIRSIVWRLRSPSNIRYEFKNLAEFIRQHNSLFLRDDLEWVRRGNGQLCRAYSGLSSLRPYLADGSPRARVVGSWKGWRWISYEDLEAVL